MMLVFASSGELGDCVCNFVYKVSVTRNSSIIV